MADSRKHDHYVFQDLDLLGNNIKSVRNVSSDDDLTLAAKSGKEVISKSPAHFEKKVVIDAQSNDNSLEVNGKSVFNDDVTIGAADNSKNLIIDGVKVYWNDSVKTLVFEKA